MAEYIDRETVIKNLEKLCDRVCQYSKAKRNVMCSSCPLGDAFTVIEDDIPQADVRAVPPGGIGEMSDGYHTFNGLYYQRKVLFASLVNAYKENAWKSYRHEDGELCFGGGWFIVGVETPKGNYTYHYENKDFDLFDCKELPVAPHWDGHTEGDVTRLLSLPDVRPVRRGRWIVHYDDIWPTESTKECSECHEEVPLLIDCKFCPNCGAEMEDGESDG